MDSELEHLLRRLRGLTLKRQSLALGLWGEAGIGKSHAARELLRAIPYQTFTVHATQSLEHTVRRIPRPKKASVWLERSIERLVLEEFFTPEQHLELMIALLTSNAPVILHVEDIHETTEERQRFWQRLASSLTRTSGVGLLVTSRTRLPEGFESIPLLPVSREASDWLLETEAGATLPPDALAWIFDRAAGNPLFTLEFFRFLSRQGFLWNDARRWRWRVPERVVMPSTVEALLEQRLRLAASTSELETALSAKALLPPNADDHLWAAMADLNLPLLQSTKAVLEQLGVLVLGAFAHPLYQEVTRHNLLTNPQRIAISRRAIQALEHDPEGAAAFVDDAQLLPEQAFALLERASLWAQRLNAELRSAQWMARAVSHLKGEAAIALALETATRLQDHDSVLAMALSERVLEARPGDVQALFVQAVLFAHQRRHDRAQAILDQIPEEVKSTPEGSAKVWQVMAYADQFEQLIERWQNGVSTERNPEIAGSLVWSLSERGRSSEATEIGELALGDQRLQGWQRVRLMNALASAYRHSGQYARAEQLQSEVIDLVIRDYQSRRIYVVYFNRALLRRWSGKYQAAIRDAEKSLHYASEAGDALHIGTAFSFLGLMDVEFGAYEQAEERLTQARELLEQLGVSMYLVDTEQALSELYNAWSDLPHGGLLSLKHANTALRYARQLESELCLGVGLTCAGMAEAIHGQPDKALALIQELGDCSASDPSTMYIGAWVQGHALERLGQFDGSLKAFTAAAIEATRLGNPHEANKIGLEIARMTGDLEQAQEHIRWFEAHGMVNGVNIGYRYFPSLAVLTPVPLPVLLPVLPPLSRLEVLGPMRFSGLADPFPVRGRKRQEFLATLLEARLSGRREVSRLDLIETLYPESSEVRAGTLLSDLVYQVRESCGVNALETTTDGYALGSVSSDAEDFLKTGNTQLWRGAFLEGLDLAERSNTILEAIDLALRSGIDALILSDPEEAVRLGRILLEANPYDPEALRLTLMALRGAGNHRGLNRAYTQARVRLLEIGETLPERWADFLETPIGAFA